MNQREIRDALELSKAINEERAKDAIRIDFLQMLAVMRNCGWSLDDRLVPRMVHYSQSPAFPTLRLALDEAIRRSEE